MQNYSPIYPYPNAYNQYVQPQVIPPQPIIQTSSGPVMAWVQGGINGAKSYPVPPNQRAYLFDSDQDTFYVKDTDQNGVPKPLRAFDYTERIIESETVTITTDKQTNYVTKEDLEEAMRKLTEDIKSSYRKGGHNNGKSFVRGTDESRDDRDVR